MDVDNCSSDGPTDSATIAIDDSLIQQFNCMGTTDKEDLIQQLRKLLGTHLNDSTAAFFLDMNNWNLQAAICSYLDIEATYNKLPSMCIVTDVNVSEPDMNSNSEFAKSWCVMNNGTECWPEGCFVKCTQGVNIDEYDKQQVWSVPKVKVGETHVVRVVMRCSKDAGVYEYKWRLFTPKGACFGDPLWAVITVSNDSTAALTQQLSHFTALGASPPPTLINPFSHQCEMIDERSCDEMHMCTKSNPVDCNIMDSGGTSSDGGGGGTTCCSEQQRIDESC